LVFYQAERINECHACKTVFTAAVTTPSPEGTVAPGSCQDEDDSCTAWAKAGYCRTAKHMWYTSVKCKYSCKFCNGKLLLDLSILESKLELSFPCFARYHIKQNSFR